MSGAPASINLELAVSIQFNFIHDVLLFPVKDGSCYLLFQKPVRRNLLLAGFLTTSEDSLIDTKRAMERYYFNSVGEIIII